ncbi:hypothetical protein CHS0354_009961 [Potamilus streckersoni]|uniref:EF-hand domain-containing protein n=1 Tax=Potamilus streckersoni TaxID=2493646 RepID=A0AAE0TCV1_9BIVA|nr:hypothetical protein CHS0354_009961 [Potamilus streckersoni]
MLNPYNMQQQAAMGMGMGMGGQYTHYGYQQGPSQHYGSYGGYFQNNVFECNAWQAYQFGTQDELQQVFMMEASRSPATAARQALQAEDLMNVMNNTHSIRNYYRINWSREMCSIMIAMLDRSRDGFMQWPEFLELQRCLVCWFNVFMQYDANRSGFIEAHELVNIIGKLFGYQLQPATMTTLLKRYSRVVYDQYSNTEKTLLAFDDFVSVCVRLRAYTDAFRARDRQINGRETGSTYFQYDDFLQCVMCL